MKLSLVGPAYDTSIRTFENQKCVNWFLEADTDTVSPNKYQAILRPTPGILQLNDFGDFDKGRASIVFRDIGYVILDNMFMYLEEDGTPSYIDSLSTTEGPIAIAPTSTGILMADGTYAYFYDINTLTFSKITDGDLPANLKSCAYLDGYYLVVPENSENAFFTIDPTAWDALDFLTINTEADYIQAVFTDHQELWFFGTKTIEVWYNSGDPDTPLQRKPNVLIQKGCRAIDSIVAMDNSFYFLGTDVGGETVVYFTNGYNAQLVPNQSGIADQISKYTTVTDAYAFSHNIGQHQFYVLTFPSENVTWVYDLLTQQWHQRTSNLGLSPFDVAYEPANRAHRARNHLYVDRTHYVLDQFSGSISKYDPNTYTEYDQAISRIRRTAQLSADHIQTGNNHEYNNQLHTYSNLVLNFEPGVGTGSGDGEDPQVQLEISRDGGFTWESLGSRSLGPIGIYNIPIKWDFIGQARNMVFQFTVTDPVKAVFLGGTVDVVKDVT